MFRVFLWFAASGLFAAWSHGQYGAAAKLRSMRLVDRLTGSAVAESCESVGQVLLGLAIVSFLFAVSEILSFAESKK